MTKTWVLGADACPAGWIGIAVSGGEIRALVHPEIAKLADSAAELGHVAAIAIDIPIGLPDAGQRQADVLARAMAGPRRSSVFTTPVRAALQVQDYHDALCVSRALTGAGISRQAFNLGDRIRQVDRWLASAPCPVVEAHPELCFAEMAGAPLPDAKSTWPGAVRRRQLLATEGIELGGDLGLAGLKVGVDDVLDAAAAAWTAGRVAEGKARHIPDPPERFSDGIAAAIWI
jgi:predicted RNase H-like nuclease